MGRIRNRDLVQWQVVVKPASEEDRTALEFLVEPEVTYEVVDMIPHTLDGWFGYPGDHHDSVICQWDIRPSENRVRFWAIAHSARIRT